MSPARSLVTAAVVLSGLLAGPRAFADDKAACLDASLQAQALRNAHKLVEARVQFQVCAASKCPAVVASDCTTWLAEVEKSLPSVVLSARSGAGKDLVDVKVSLDGKPLVSSLDGQAMPMNAGLHTFHFEGADGTILDQQFVVREGEKNQAVAVVLGPAPPQKPATSPDNPADAGSPSSTWKTAGWVLGGVGIIGLGVGTVFGVVALGNKSSDCPTASTCKDGSLGGLRSEAHVSDIGLIAGGVLLASGAALVLFAPSGTHEASSGLKVAPVLTATGGAIVAGGSW